MARSSEVIVRRRSTSSSSHVRQSSAETESANEEAIRERILPYNSKDLSDFLAYYDNDRKFEEIFADDLQQLLMTEESVSDEESQQFYPYKQRLEDFYFPLSNILIINIDRANLIEQKDRFEDAIDKFHHLIMKYDEAAVAKGLDHEVWFSYKHLLIKQAGLSIILNNMGITTDFLDSFDDYKFPENFQAIELRKDVTSFMKSYENDDYIEDEQLQSDLKELCTIFSHRKGSRSGINLIRLHELMDLYNLDEFKQKMINVYNKLEDLLLPKPLRIGKYVEYQIVDNQLVPLHEKNWSEEKRSSSGPYRRHSSASQAAPGSARSSTPAAFSATAVNSGLSQRKSSGAASGGVRDVGSAVNHIKQKYDRVDPIISAMGINQMGSAPAPLPPQQHSKPMKKRPHVSQAELDVNESDDEPPTIHRKSLPQSRRKNIVVDDIEEEDGDDTGRVASAVKLLKSSASAASAAQAAVNQFPDRLTTQAGKGRRSGRKRSRTSFFGERSEEDHFLDELEEVEQKNNRRGSSSKGGEKTRRVRWTEAETDCLRQAVEELSRSTSGEKPTTLWRDILNHPDYKDVFAGRTNVNLKDKYRNILKEDMRRTEREDYLDD